MTDTGNTSVDSFIDYMRYELARSEHTIIAYQRDLLQFIRFVTGPSGICSFRPEEVDTRIIRQWIASLAEAGEAPTSLRRKTQSLRAYFKFLCRRSGLKTNPADAVILAKLPKPLPDFVADQDLTRLLDLDDRNPDQEYGNVTDPLAIRNHLILHILYATGVRCSELLSLTDEDINFSLKQIKIYGKGKKERIVPLADALINEIRRWQVVRDETYPDLPVPRPIIATKFGAMSPSNLELIVRQIRTNENAVRK
ncbi:MAG: site-specific integrase [Muribaculaceae bacterium]|nr:site-specific integrase [Muribaculaceae bacterium]